MTDQVQLPNTKAIRQRLDAMQHQTRLLAAYIARCPANPAVSVRSVGSLSMAPAASVEKPTAAGKATNTEADESSEDTTTTG